MKRLIGVILTIALLIGSISLTRGNTNTMDASIQENAAKSYERLISSFSTTHAESKIYPENYGGAYINDTGHLVVLVTSLSERLAILNNTEGVIYKHSKFSYNELLSVMKKLNDYKFNNPTSVVAMNYNEFGLYDSKNRIIVKLDNLSEESIRIFKESVSNSETILFEQGSGPAQTEINVNAGSLISTPTGTASVGYRVRRNGVNGFVTAGHAIATGGVLRSGNINFATCVVSQQANRADAAFCWVTNANYTPSNTLSGTSNLLSTTISEPGVGTTINKIGYKTGHTTGKVLSINATTTFTSGVTISNLTSADYISEKGDSGGVVYSYISSTNTRPTLGIHTGANGTTKYFTKANEINSALGTSRY